MDTDVSFEDGRNVFRCSNCTFPVQEESSKPTPAPPRPAPAASAEPSPSGALFKSIVIAEDGETLRQLLKLTLERHRIGEEVHLTQNGEQFVEVAAQRLYTGALIDLAILDVEMPVMNGYCAAIVLRAMERAFGIASRVPILFFSGRVCDATFKSALDYCQPARYLNKGVGVSSLDQVAQRLTKVLSSLKR